MAKNWRKGGKRERRIGAPSVDRKFAGWRKGAQMWGVRGSGVEGRLRPVPRGRPAKKKKKKHNHHHHHAVYSISGKKGKWSKKDCLSPFCCVGIIHFWAKGENGRYRLGARFARGSCERTWAPPSRHSLRSRPRPPATTPARPRAHPPPRPRAHPPPRPPAPAPTRPRAHPHPPLPPYIVRWL